MIKLVHGCGFILTLVLFVPSKTASAQEFAQHSFSIYFDTDKDHLDAGAMSLIRHHMIDIGSSNIRGVYLKGHADSDSDTTYNLSLSERRALNTKQFLLEQGVPNRLISVQAFGETMPAGGQKNKNRRVELTIYYVVDASKSGNKIIVANVVHAHSKKPMGADYAIERNGSNSFGKTNRKGSFIISVNSGQQTRIMVSRKDFLSDVRILNPRSKELMHSEDTVYVEFQLNPVEVVEKITFNHIFFYTDLDLLRPESEADLQKLLHMLHNNKDLYIQIQGHVNFPVTRNLTPALELYNHDLSFRRARTVFTYLVDQGVDPSRLTYIGLGNAYMVYPDPKNSQEADMNKRVEIWKLKKI